MTTVYLMSCNIDFQMTPSKRHTVIVVSPTISLIVQQGENYKRLELKLLLFMVQSNRVPPWVSEFEQCLTLIQINYINQIHESVELLFNEYMSTDIFISRYTVFKCIIFDTLTEHGWKDWLHITKRIVLLWHLMEHIWYLNGSILMNNL